MNIVVVMMLFQGVFSNSLPVKRVSELEINCVGRCEVHSVKGKKIELNVNAPDSMQDKFGIKKEDDRVVCGVTESIKNDNSIEGIGSFFKGIKDSVKIDIGIPEKLLVDTLIINSGIARVNATFSRYYIYSLELNAGAGHVVFNFKDKNHIKKGKITINAGVGSIRINRLENFLADSVYINSGIASVVINFKDKPHVKPLHVYLSSAMSSFTMVLPHSVTCEKGKIESFLSLKSLENCDSDKGDIVLNVNGALSSIDVIREDKK